MSHSRKWKMTDGPHPDTLFGKIYWGIVGTIALVAATLYFLIILGVIVLAIYLWFSLPHP